MSQVAACRDKRQVIPIPYAPGGCPVKLGEEKCGETQGLDIIKDFHQLYQEKMSQIDVSAGGDSLQEKVDLQQKWIDDLTEQNRMLARVIAELETEAIGRLQQLENKLQNAAKSFSEEDVEALAERDRKIKELEEALNSQTSTENNVENDSDRKSRENATQGIGSDKQREETKFESKDSDYSGGRKDEDQIKQEIRKIREQSSKDMPPGDEGLYEDGRQKQEANEGSTGTDRGKAEDSSDEKRKSGGQSKYSSDDKKKNYENYAMKQDVILSSPSFTTQDDDTSDLPLCPVRKIRPCSPETCRKASIKLKEIATSNMNENYPDSPKQEEFTSTYSEKETKEKATPTICPVKKVPCTSETCKKNSRKSPEPTGGVRTNSIVISVTSAGKQDASRSKLAENLEKKSVHLLIENNKENMIVEPEKDHDQGSLDISKPRIESVPVIGVQDSLEILKGTVKTQSSERSLLNEETQNSECICESKNYVDEFMKLKEENKMFREGEEIRRLKNELDEKMKRILELNEENRTLNEMVNALKCNQVLPPGSEPASVKQPVSTTSSAYGSDLPTEEEMKTEPLTGEPKDTSDEMPTASMKSTDKETPVSEGASVGAAAPIEIQGDSGQKMPDDGGTPTEVQEEIDQKMPQDSTTPTEGQKDIEQKVPTDTVTPIALPEQAEQKTPADAVPPCAQSEKKKPSTADKSCQEPCICLPDETTTKDSGRDDSKPQQPPRVSEYAAGEADKKPSPVPDSVVERPETSEKPSVVMGKGEEPYPVVKEEVSVIVEEKSSAEEKEEKKPEAEDTEKASKISKGEDKPTSENEGALINIGDMTQPPEYEVPQTKSSEKPPTIVEDITASSTDEKPLAVSDQEPSIIVSEKAPTVSKDEDKATSENEGGLLTIGDMTQPPEYEVPQTKSSEKPPTIVEDITPTSTDERAIDVSDQEPSIIESEKIPTIAKGDDIQTTMDEKLPTEASKEPSTIASEKPSVTIREVEPSPITSEKPSVTITEVGPTPIASEKPSATVTEVEPTPIASEKPSVTIKEEPTTTGVIDKPSKDISEKPSDIPSEKDDGIIIDDFLSPEKRSMPISDQSDKVIIRCICKSKYCKIVPDPNNPHQKLCVDVSETLLEAGEDDNCMCLPSCPRKDAFTQNSKPDVSKGEKEKSSGSDTPLGSNIPTNETRQAPITPKDALVYSTKPRHEFEQHFSSYRSFHSDRGQSFNSLKKLSKEQEYAGLSRKETEPWKKTTHIPPRKSASAYGIQEDATDTSDLKDVDETKNADLKIVIADLKNKLLDAEDKIEELKNIKNFGNKDNNTALIMRYSEEIDHLKKSLKWTSKEKEEYEFLKQKVKLLEQGKGDTDNITSNLQTAEDRSVMKVQLKKLSKKNKCYEEIVQFFKEEMSVMSDELLTLQEVLNVTNVSSQEENTKLINAILQLRRINDRLVSHLCEIEKQVVLENQINQINEARINELQNIIGSKNNDLNQHDQTIQEMRKKLNNATKQNADLKKTIKNLTDAVVEIQEGIKSVERDHNRNKNDASVVESNVCLASGNLKDIKCCIENKNDKITELENKLKSQEVSIILATKELDVLKEKKADYKKLVVSLKEQLASYDKKNEEMMGDFQLVSTQLQDYVNLDHMKNYEIGHYKSLVEEMKMSLMQLNQGLEKFEASNIHFYEDMSNAEICCDKNGTSSRVFSELKKSMADMKRRLSDAEFKGGLIEEELLKVKESHMSQIREEVTESQKELETRILASIEEQANLNMLVEQQKEEIEHLKKELHREKLESSNYKQNLSKLQNENMTSNAQMEILHLKCELNKSLQRQRVLSEENDKIHSKMISLRKKLSTIEEAYEIMKQENEENKMQLKKTLREKEYIAHKNQELTKNIEDMRSSHDQLERQCRYNSDCMQNLQLELSETQTEKDNISSEAQNLAEVVKMWLKEQNVVNGEIRGKFQNYSNIICSLRESMMKRMSQEKSWVKKPMQQPFSPRHYTPTPQSERRSSSPSRNRGQERNTCDVRYRSMSPWRNYDGYNRIDLIDEDAVSRKSHQMRNISYDSNPSAFSSRSPSPRSDFLQEVEVNNLNLNDWFSPNFKETDTDADEGDDEMFINKLHVLTAQVQEANKRWQQKMNTNSLPTSRGKRSN